MGGVNRQGKSSRGEARRGEAGEEKMQVVLKLGGKGVTWLKHTKMSSSERGPASLLRMIKKIQLIDYNYLRCPLVLAKGISSSEEDILIACAVW